MRYLFDQQLAGKSKFSKPTLCTPTIRTITTSPRPATHPVMACDGAYYELLGIPHDASVADVKRAFRRKALAAHPDRNPDPSAHAAFQRLRRVHDVLVDEELRRVYDDGGEAAVDDEGFSGDAAFWAHAEATVTKEDIEKCERDYPRSKDEKEDLAEHYNRFEGNVQKVLDYIPFSEESDLLRFIATWDAMIRDGTLPTREAYKPARSAINKRAQRAAKRSKKQTAKQTEDSTDDGSFGAGEVELPQNALAALLKDRASQREQNFNAWADSLAEKYKDQDKPRRKFKKRLAKNQQETSSKLGGSSEDAVNKKEPAAGRSNLKGAVQKKRSK
jgi:DnaJ homolog subfamily C member 9